MEKIVMTISQFIEFVNNRKQGGEFVSVTLNTEPKMNKGRGANRNPLLGRVRKISEGSYRFNADYERICRAKQVKQGLEPTFKAEPMSGRTWLVPNKVEQSFDGATFYLRLYVAPIDNYEYHYEVDGRVATAEEVEIIKYWLSASSNSSKKQLEEGIPVEEQLEVRSPKITSIKEIRIGRKTIIIAD